MAENSTNRQEDVEVARRVLAHGEKATKAEWEADLTTAFYETEEAARDAWILARAYLKLDEEYMALSVVEQRHRESRDELQKENEKLREKYERAMWGGEPLNTNQERLRKRVEGLERLFQQKCNVILEQEIEISGLRDQVKALTQVVILHQKKLKEHHSLNNLSEDTIREWGKRGMRGCPICGDVTVRGENVENSPVTLSLLTSDDAEEFRNYDDSLDDVDVDCNVFPPEEKP
jgi:hypothetical protein